MWMPCNSCMGRKKARVLIDQAVRRTSCPDCGHELEDNDTVRVADPINPSRDLGTSQKPASDSVFVATSQPKNASFDDGLSSIHRHVKSHVSNPLSIATIKTHTASSDGFLPSNLVNLQQNQSFDPLSIATTKQTKATLIATMSLVLGLPGTVEDKANEIFKKLAHSSRENAIPTDAFSAACIYIACRFIKDQTRSLTEISSALYKVTIPEIRNAVEFIADRLGFSKDKLLKIKAVDFMKRFCSKLGMNSEEVKAAEEAARSYDVINTSKKGSDSVAAAVLYVIGRISYEKKLFKDIIEATGLPGSRINAAYTDLYPNLLTITPKSFASAHDLKNLGCP